MPDVACGRLVGQMPIAESMSDLHFKAKASFDESCSAGRWYPSFRSDRILQSIGSGGDNGGSLRNPGVYCNIVGFRPSIGRVPNPK